MSIESDDQAFEPVRTSIVHFLEAEARKFTNAARVVLVDQDKRDRLEDKASILRTMAAYIARGDDKAGT